MQAAEQVLENEQVGFDNLTRVEFPTNKDDPFELIQFTSVLLAHLDSPREFAHALVEFVDPRVLEHIDERPSDFYILSVVWLSAIKRVLENHAVEDFPYEFLGIPIMFKEWNWKLEMTDEWKAIYNSLLERLDQLPASAEDHVHASIPLFCIEAIFDHATPAPFEAMSARLRKKLPEPQYTDALLSLGMILGRNGWSSGY